MVEKTEQQSMKECIVCSQDNPASLGARFFTVGKDEVQGVFTGRDIHCSYEGRMHGGMISAVLDETMGRALWADEPDKFAVTAKLDVVFLRPVPLGIELKSIGKIKSRSEKGFTAEGRILLPDGNAASVATGLYVIQSTEQIKNVKR